MSSVAITDLGNMFGAFKFNKIILESFFMASDPFHPSIAGVQSFCIYFGGIYPPLSLRLDFKAVRSPDSTISSTKFLNLTSLVTVLCEPDFSIPVL